VKKKKPTAAQNAARKSKRTRIFGPNAVCYFCPFANPIGLIAIDRTVLEEHHVAGVNHDPRLQLPVCRNCHALLHEGYLDGGVALRRQRSLLETLAEIDRALAVFFRAASIAHADRANQLDQFIDALDHALPNWRSICETEE
jgi:hypothetical protein